MRNIIFIIILVSLSIAETNNTFNNFSKIWLSGDARIRPRLDIMDYGDKSSMDLYYLYRARLNIKADIGNGWFFNSQLGTNEAAGMTKMGDSGKTYLYIDKDDEDGQLTDEELDTLYIKKDYPGKQHSIRPQISFLNLYFGIKKENFGLWGGLIPLEHNPSLDIHYYSDLIIDIPWSRLNNNSIAGFSGYIYKLNWFLSVDQNKQESSKKEDLSTKSMDSYSLGLDFSMEWNEIIENITTRGIVSMGDLYESLPMTGGLDLNFIQMFGINALFSYHYSTQFVNKNVRYDITHLRIKLDREIGPGKLTLWTDIASRVDKKIENLESKTDYIYLWLDYDYNLLKANFGSVSIKPTIRMLNEKNIDSDYNNTRMKLELTTEIKFK